jgi:isoleucyl-tRNA synthetase
MLVRTVEMSERMKKFYEEMMFHRVYHEMHNFCAVDLSQVYFDVLKDRLYTGATNSKARRSAQTAIWRIGEAMVRLFAPMMSFTADEIWQYLPKTQDRFDSVHLASFPSTSEVYGAEVPPSAIEKLNVEWSALMSVRDEALKALESARQNKEIGANLEAKVKISVAEPLYSLLAARVLQLRALLIVSGVSVERTAGTNGTSSVRVEVARADGQKCERCWNYSVHVGENAKFPTICERCTAALNEMEKAKV